MNQLSLEKKREFLASVPRGDRIFAINSRDEVCVMCAPPGKHTPLQWNIVGDMPSLETTSAGRQGSFCIAVHVPFHFTLNLPATLSMTRDIASLA